MNIQLAETDEQVLHCHFVMRHLRDVEASTFLERVRLQERAGYRLAFLSVNGAAVAVAGFRVGNNLAWGKHLYVDDLVTLPEARSSGRGASLIAWLSDFAKEKDASRCTWTLGLSERTPIASTSGRALMFQACTLRRSSNRRITAPCGRPPTAAADRPVRHTDTSKP